MTIDASVTVPAYNANFHRGSPPGGGGGGGGGGGLGGDSHVKVMGMLVVLLRGVHCRFWSRLGCLRCHSGIA